MWYRLYWTVKKSRAQNSITIIKTKLHDKENVIDMGAWDLHMNTLVIN